jgi:hypothetical protein
VRNLAAGTSSQSDISCADNEHEHNHSINHSSPNTNHNNNDDSDSDGRRWGSSHQPGSGASTSWLTGACFLHLRLNHADVSPLVLVSVLVLTNDDAGAVRVAKLPMNALSLTMSTDRRRTTRRHRRLQTRRDKRHARLDYSIRQATTETSVVLAVGTGNPLRVLGFIVG